jgi:hypothetical protein
MSNGYLFDSLETVSVNEPQKPAFRFRQSHAKILLTECADELRRVLESKKQPTKAMEGGTLFDYVVSGRDNKYVVVDELDGNGEQCTNWKGGAAKAARKVARERGLVAALPSELDALRPQADRAARRLFNLKAEHDVAESIDHEVLYWTSELGVACQGEPDWAWLTRDGYVFTCDLKRTASLNPRFIQRQTFAMCWDVQGAAYREAAMAWAGDYLERYSYGGHYLLLCEQEGRGRVLARQLSAVTMAIGKRRWENAQREFLECTSSGVWPDYPEDEIDAPNYMVRDVLEREDPAFVEEEP